MHHRTDDHVHRISLTYLGPVTAKGPVTFPWPAVRVASYVMFAVVLVGILTLESAVTTGPVLVPPPVVEVILAIGLTWGLMRSVSHERPLSAVLRWITAEADTRMAAAKPAPRPQRRQLRITQESE